MDLKTGNKYLFDTTVYIDALRGRPNGRNLIYQAKFKPISVGYSLITEAELWAGIKGFRTPEQHKILLRPFHRYMVNVTIARRAGFLRMTLDTAQKGQQTPSIMDCLIAATAEYYGLTVCSANARDFSRFQLFSIPSLMYKN